MIGVGVILKGLLFLLGNYFVLLSDELVVKFVESLMIFGVYCDCLIVLCYIGKGEDDSVGLMEKVFLVMYSVKGLECKL